MVVSILYEADRLCNQRPDVPGLARKRVSILYEADRLCNWSWLSLPVMWP